MKHYIHIFLCLFIGLISFSSCEKENYDIISIEEEPSFNPDEFSTNSLAYVVKEGNNTAIQLACVELDLPLSLKLEGGQTLLVNTFEEFEQALDPSATVRVLDFQYPVQGRDHNGMASSFENSLSLGTIYASCIPSKGWSRSIEVENSVPAFLLDDYCLDLVYPVDLEDVNGSVFIANNKTDFIKHLINNEELYFTLPLSLSTGSQEEDVDNLNELLDLMASCENGKYQALTTLPDTSIAINNDCFTFVYPFDVELIVEDTIITINNEAELIQLELSGVEAELLFPVDVIDINGNTVTINAPEDLIPVIIDCGILIVDTTFTDCGDIDAHVLLFYNGLNIFTTNNYVYEFIYPITLIVEGSSTVLNSNADYLPAIGNDPFSFKEVDIQYPVSIIQFGRTITLNSDEDVCEFYQTLDEACGNKPAHIQLFYNTEVGGIALSCLYWIDYPVEISRNGDIISIDSRASYLSELNTPNAYNEIELVYPIGVQSDAGVPFTFTSDDDLCNYLDNCR
jgi:hypothetical protein